MDGLLNNETPKIPGLVKIRTSTPAIPETPSIDEIRELLTSHRAVQIPAGEGRYPIRILAKPGYIKVDHGVNLLSLDEDWVESRSKSNPIIYAIYMFGIGEEAKDIRSLRLPVQFNGTWWKEEDRITQEMIIQGFDKNEIKSLTNVKLSKAIVGQVAGKWLMDLQMAIRINQFTTRETNPDPDLYPIVETLHSGWSDTDNRYQFVVLARKGSDGGLWHIEIPPGEKIAWNERGETMEELIAPIPINQAIIEQSGPESKKLLKRIIKANKDS